MAITIYTQQALLFKILDKNKINKMESVLLFNQPNK